MNRQEVVVMGALLGNIADFCVVDYNHVMSDLQGDGRCSRQDSCFEVVAGSS